MTSRQRHAADPPILLVEDKDSLRAMLRHALEAQGNSTRVTVTEHGEVYNPIFRVVSKYIMGQTSTIDSYLTALGKKFGNDVTPADAAPVPLK